MMSFLHPDVLYYLLPLVIVLFGFLLTQKEAQAHFFTQEIMEKLRVNSRSLTIKTRNVLFMIMSVLIIVALAGPVIKEGTVQVKAKSADIMIALDISDSMLAQDVYPNRLNAAKQKAMELLKLAPNERLGVIAFAKNSYLVSPLSFDHNAVGFLLRQLDTTSITEKGTNLMSMLEVVDNSVKKESKKYLLIMSDGGDNDDFSKEIEFAKEKNIAIFVLGIGTAKGAPIKMKDGSFIKQKGEIIVSTLNENISNLATKTGGVYIQNVRSNEDVKTMAAEIEKHSVKRELKSEEVERFVALFYYPLALALFLFLIATSSFFKRSNALVAAFALFAVFLGAQDANAGLLDFMKLEQAKKAYDAKEYDKSLEVYEEYAKRDANAESYYNAANSLYKQEKYEEAIKSYEQAGFEDAENNAKKYSNIGNAYAKQNKPELLQKAVESYEASLKLQEDKETRENLEAVKKALEEQKKEDKKNEEKKEDDKDKKDDKKDDKDSDKKEDDKKDGSQDDKKSDEKKDDEKSKKDESKEENNETKEPEPKKDELKELTKEDDNKTDDSKQEQNAQASEQTKMSDEEEAKWLNELNQQKGAYLYMLNKENKNEEDSNEKPW